MRSETKLVLVLPVNLILETTFAVEFFSQFGGGYTFIRLTVVPAAGAPFQQQLA